MSILDKKIQLGSNSTLYTNSSYPVSTTFTDSASCWADVPTASSNTLVGICWSNELGIFVAVSPSGTYRVLVSSDGKIWNEYASSRQATWVGVDWSPYLGLFAAVAFENTNAVMTSPNGKVWTTRTTPGTGHTWQKIIWSPDLRMFVAIDGSAGGGPAAMYSYDAITWTEASTPLTDFVWYDVAWSPQLGMFAAVASSGTTSENGVMTSYDGITWTMRNHNSSQTSQTFGGIAWSPDLGMFVALSNNGGLFSIRSSNGINWYAFSTSGGAWQRGCWCSGLKKFLFLGGSGASYISSDGITWSNYAHNATNTRYSITWCPVLGKAIAVGDYPIESFTPIVTIPSSFPLSYDYTGITGWTPVVNGNNSLLRTVIWCKELSIFVAVGGASGVANQVATSTDGTNWTFRSSASDLNWNGIAWSPTLGLFAAVAGTDSSSSAMTSPDGITWTSRTTPTTVSHAWNVVIWVPELSMFLAGTGLASSSLAAMYSYDGITWTEATTPALNRNMFAMAWSPELRIAVSVSHQNNSGDGIYTTTDGITWVSRSHPAGATNLLSVAWSPTLKLFAIAAYLSGSNYGLTSPDGINWTLNTNVTSGVWHSMCWAEGLQRFITVNGDSGSPGVLLSSDGINWSSQTTAGSKTGVCWSEELGVAVACGFSTYNIEKFTPTARTQSNVKGTFVSELSLSNIDNKLYSAPDRQTSIFEITTTSVSTSGTSSSNYVDIIKLLSGGSFCHFDLFVTAREGPVVKSSYVLRNGFASKNRGQYNTLSVVAPTTTTLLELDTGTDVTVGSNRNNVRVTVNGSSSISTTINSGATLPQSTITVVSTTGFNTFGVLFIQSASGVQKVSYTGTTSTTFTGCSGGVGVMSVGGVVSPAIVLVWKIKAKFNAIQNSF